MKYCVVIAVARSIARAIASYSPATTKSMALPVGHIGLGASPVAFLSASRIRFASSVSSSFGYTSTKCGSAFKFMGIPFIEELIVRNSTRQEAA